MSSKTNIGGNNTDTFWRYKRDILIIKYENTKGTRTKLVNIDKIANQLHLSKKILLKELQKCLGIPIHNDYVQSQIELKILENHINTIIQKYVICKKCQLPELKNNICLACGNNNGKSVTKSKTKSKKINIDNKIKILTNSKELDNNKIIDQKSSELLKILYEKRDNGYDQTIINNLIDKLWNITTEEQIKNFEEEIRKF
jgi:ribosomal protein L32